MGCKRKLIQDPAYPVLLVSVEVTADGITLVVL